MKKILVIDDEFDILEALGLALPREGYEVITCHDARNALALVREKKPDLIITDLMMPFHSGYELLLTLKGEPETKNIPVILMSSANPSAKQVHFRWDAFVRKPFDFPSLLKEVNALTSKREPDPGAP